MLIRIVLGIIGGALLLARFSLPASGSVVLHAAAIDGTHISIGEPVWITVNLTNNGDKPATVYQDRQDTLGVSIVPEPGTLAAVRRHNRTAVFDTQFRRIELKPQESVSAVLLLNDFVDIVRSGDARLVVHMRLQGENLEPLALSSTLSLTVTGKLTRAETTALVQKFEGKYQSSDSGERRRAVQSMVAVDISDAAPLLKRAVLDPNDYVAVAAVRVAAASPSPLAVEILKAAEASSLDIVRQAAQHAIADRKTE